MSTIHDAFHSGCHNASHVPQEQRGGEGGQEGGGGEIGPYPEPKAHKAKARRSADLKAGILLHKLLKELCQSEMMPDVLLQALRTICTDHEP